MAQEIDYKFLPSSYQAFLEDYAACFTETMVLSEEYLKYLKQNASHHHYNGETLETWYDREVKELALDKTNS